MNPQKLKSYNYVLILFIISLLLQSCSGRRMGGALSYGKSLPSTIKRSRDPHPSVKQKTTTDKKKYSRMVIYTGSLGIKVFDIEGTIIKVTRITSEFKGYVESSVSRDSYRYSKIVVRIPVKDFNLAMRRLAELGEVFEHSTKADDVTSQFFDLKMRLNLAQKARLRLYDLLKKAAKIEQRIRILKEIERLTNFIEKMTKEKDILAKRAAFSTIYITLKTRIQSTAGLFVASPFYWITKIGPFKRSIYSVKGIDEDKIPTPKSFLSNWKKFKKGYSGFAFFSPDRTRIRIGSIKNYPKGDAAFWIKALTLECKNRGYTLASTNKLAKVAGDKRSVGSIFHYRISDGLNSYYYNIYLSVDSKYIYIIEADFPNKKALLKHKKNIQSLINNFHNKG